MRRAALLTTCAVVLSIAGGARVAAHGPPSAATPACFGAASRDPLHPCHNASLRLAVVPTPAEARNVPNAPCGLTLVAGLSVCAFGVAEGAATTVALVGDSHAADWRAAVEVVAQSERWHGVSLTHSSCPLSSATRDLPTPARHGCARWRRRVLSWFGRHPEVSTLFVSALSGGTGVVPDSGRSEFETAVHGYMRAWKALPASVGEIVVLRDTPKVRSDTDRCVEHAMARHARPGPACAVPRAAALGRDPLVAAAQRLRSPRVRVIDLTRVFCGAAQCYPVVGGALVYKDAHHLTRVFAATLGPLLQREVHRSIASGS